MKKITKNNTTTLPAAPEPDESGAVWATADTSPLNHQVGGDHYRELSYQPIQYILENDLHYVEGRVTEYMARWRKKGGVQDLEKARHLLDLSVEFYKGKK